MSTAFLQFGEPQPLEALERIRARAAQVHALLDELDSLAPISAGRSDTARVVSLSEQHAEELDDLGHRILECAAAMTAIPAKPPQKLRGR
jgi:hypothetical protein